jgi:hypothetical protein
MTPTRKKTTHYVDNKKFYEEIVSHKKKVAEAKEKGLPAPRINNYIGECIKMIAERLSNHPWFCNYSYKDEMISDGIENCFLYFDNFDPDKTQNPFAYFTQIIYFAFQRRKSKEEKNRYIIYKNFQETIINYGLDKNLVDGDDNNLISFSVYDNISDAMERFEKKEAEKKAKRKEAKEGLLQFYEEKQDEQQQ